MAEGFLLDNPAVVTGFAIALCICIFSLIKKPRVIVTVVSAVIFTATLTYALLKGMGLYEAGCTAAVFFIFNLAAIKRRGGK